MLESANADIVRRRKRKGLKTIGLSLLLILAFTAGITIALLNTRTGTEVNDLAFGQSKIEVVENDYSWESKEVKLVAATGAGYVPGAARVMFVPYILDDAGNYISCALAEMSEPVDGKMVLGDLVLEFADDWETYWFYQDGYFYYRTVLYPEAGKNETTILLKKVTFAGDPDAVKEKYNDAEIKVDVLASILQAEGSAPDSGSVLETDWGITVNGDTISPKQ